MNENLIIGLLASFVPLFAVGYLMLNKQPPIFRMFIAMLLVGLGYLTMTGAIEDIGARVSGKSGLADGPAPAATDKAAAPAAGAPAATTAPAAAPAAEAPKDPAPPADAKPAGAY